jgi:O-antigen/teichoic acid export membrane protein
VTENDSERTSASTVSFGGETVKATAAKFTMALSGFVGTILFANWLGPAEFGGFYVVMNLIRLVDRPLGGWSIAVKKRFAENNSDQSKVFGALFAMAVCWNTIAIMGAWTFAGPLREYTGLSWSPTMFSLLMPALSLLPFLALVEATGRIGVSKWVDSLRSYLTLGLQILFVYAGFEAAGMAFGLAAATFLSVPLALRYLPVRPSIPDQKTIRSVWTFARYTIPRSYVGQAYVRFDALLLAFIIAPSAAGNYEVAARLTLPATFVAATAASLLMPRVSELSTTGNEVATDITNALSFSSIVAIPMFFGALAIPRELIVTLYGNVYEGAWLLLGGLAAYRLLATQTEPLYQALDGLDRPEVSFRVSTVALIVNIPLGVVLVLEIGAVGVVLATVIAEAIRYFGAAWAVQNHVENVSLISSAITKQLLMGAVMFGIVYAVNEVIAINSWLHLLAVVGVGAAVYSVGLFAISKELRMTVDGIAAGTGLEQYIDPIIATLGGVNGD